MIKKRIKKFIKEKSLLFKITKERSRPITYPLLYKKFNVYTGKYYDPVIIKKTMLGYKLGEFLFTKKLGAMIHKSERNKKKQEKLQQKHGKKK